MLCAARHRGGLSHRRDQPSGAAGAQQLQAHLPDAQVVRAAGVVRVPGDPAGGAEAGLEARRHARRSHGGVLPQPRRRSGDRRQGRARSVHGRRNDGGGGASAGVPGHRHRPQSRRLVHRQDRDRAGGSGGAARRLRAAGGAARGLERRRPVARVLARAVPDEGCAGRGSGRHLHLLGQARDLHRPDLQARGAAVQGLARRAQGAVGPLPP